MLRVFLRSVLLLSPLLIVACADRGDSGDGDVVLKKVAEIGDPGAPAGLSEQSRTVLAGGAFLSAPSFADGVLAHGADGRYRRMLGRQGRGPGEFATSYLTYVVGGGDGIHVVDVAGGRWMVLDSAGLMLRNTAAPFVSLGTWFALPDDTLLAIAGIAKPGPGDGKPLHYVSARGAITSFGPETPADTGRFYQLAPARDGGLWTLQVQTYRVTKWSPTGALARTFVIERPWYVARETDHRPTAESLLRNDATFGFDIRDRPDGLWIVTGRVRKDWTVPENYPMRDGFADPSVTADKYEAVVEVLDPATGALLHTGTFERTFRFINDTLVFTRFVTDDGEERQRIYRVGLKGEG
jgi:hypothetical protein